MAKGANQKQKLLVLARLFSEQTDEEHGLTLREINAKLEGYGIKPVSRNTLYGDIEELRMFGLDIITENSDPEGLKLTLDTYWAYYAGEDVPAVINKFGKRIAVTHFKDMQILNGERTMTEMLTGIIDYDPIMKACDDNDIYWNFIEQDKVYIDAFESMKISHDNMKKRYNLD